jgi:hypothetical protein
MRPRTAVPFLIAGGLLIVGCQKEPDKTTTTTETKTTAVGSTAESTSTTKVDSPAGDSKVVTSSYLGTVTEFTPGKSIEVLTGNKESHKVDLGGERTSLVMDPSTKVGSKILLVEEKGDDGFHRVTISIAPAA